MLFLSYAEGDSVIADQIAEWFRAKNLDVYNWRAPEHRGQRFLEKIQQAMAEADDFVALLSPTYLDSYWCQREKDLALQRERDLRKVDRDRTFIHVLLVSETSPANAGFLRDYDWASLVGKSDVAPELTNLHSKLWPGTTEDRAGSQPHLSDTAAASGQPNRPDSVPANLLLNNTACDIVDEIPTFRNREHELERVSATLHTPGSICFWLVTAPPELGKSWFLRRVRDEASKAGWITRFVDLRQQPPEARRNVAAIVGLLFDTTPPNSIGQKTQHDIALEICRNGIPQLCVLDSAELLEQADGIALRSCLSGIYREVEDGVSGARFGFVVASRTEDRWRSATQSPRLSVLTLSEFSQSVVHQALVDLANITVGDPFRINLRNIAALAYAATEGLPALLTACLRWIRREQWLRLSRLASQEQFEELAGPYIKEGLLARESLLPEAALAAQVVSADRAGHALNALEHAYRALAPYRLFTQSHVRYRLENDPGFKAAISDLGWSLPDLWNAIGDAALLLRPLDEPWQEIHPAIRRLLYRYFYKSPAARSAAHQEALRFVEVWGEKQLGKEQIVGLVECLWHEAMALRDGRPKEFERRLAASARSLSLELKPSPLYTVDELRHYASERIRNDVELDVAVKGLSMKLVEIVKNPLQPRET